MSFRIARTQRHYSLFIIDGRKERETFAGLTETEIERIRQRLLRAGWKEKA